MTKSELISCISKGRPDLTPQQVESVVKAIVEYLGEALATGKRIEIRGFGSFSLHYRPGRIGRNPKTGETVELNAKYVAHFKPGKELRDRVNNPLEPASPAERLATTPSTTRS